MLGQCRQTMDQHLKNIVSMYVVSRDIFMIVLFSQAMPELCPDDNNEILKKTLWTNIKTTIDLCIVSVGVQACVFPK